MGTDFKLFVLGFRPYVTEWNLIKWSGFRFLMSSQKPVRGKRVNGVEKIEEELYRDLSGRSQGEGENMV